MVGSYAIVAYYYMSYGYRGGLQPLDISNPADPRPIGEWGWESRLELNTAAWDIAVAGGYAYAACGDGGMHVVDIADPEHGGRYTVKLYDSDKEPSEEGGWRHRVVRLKPDSTDPRFEPIVLKAVNEGELEVIAEVVQVMNG